MSVWLAAAIPLLMSQAAASIEPMARRLVTFKLVVDNP